MSESLLHLINQWRQSQNKPILYSNSQLQRLALRYSKDMYERNFFSHIDPDQRSVQERLWCAGMDSPIWGENLAKTYDFQDNPQYILDAWLNSLSHRTVLEKEEYIFTGIGCYTTHQGICYITMILTGKF